MTNTPISSSKAPNASAQDVHDLHLKMIDAVKEKFDLQLIREVRFVGKFNNTLQDEPRRFLVIIRWILLPADLVHFNFW